MRWFNKKKKSTNFEKDHIWTLPHFSQETPPPGAAQLIAKLPPPILERVFSYVCPHTQDETYESCEQSAVEDTCMLCDLRDLAHCARVSRRWRVLAANVL